MTREPDSTGFDDIVAAWRAEGNVPQWPDDPQLDEPAADARTGVGTDAPADRPGGLFDADDDPPSHAADPDRRGGAVGRDGDPHTDDAANWRGEDGERGRGGTPPTEDATDGPGGPSERGHREVGRAGDSPEDATDGRGGNGQPGRAGGAESPTESPADEHFVPPEPPPLPRMGPPILVGLTLVALGLVLVTFPGWVGVPQVYGLPLGLVAIAAGLGWLVLRLWPDPDDVPPPLYLDDPDDPDGGAVL